MPDGFLAHQLCTHSCFFFQKHHLFCLFQLSSTPPPIPPRANAVGGSSGSSQHLHVSTTYIGSSPPDHHQGPANSSSNSQQPSSANPVSASVHVKRQVSAGSVLVTTTPEGAATGQFASFKHNVNRDNCPYPTAQCSRSPNLLDMHLAIISYIQY